MHFEVKAFLRFRLQRAFKRHANGLFLTLRIEYNYLLLLQANVSGYTFLRVLVFFDRVGDKNGQRLAEIRFIYLYFSIF